MSLKSKKIAVINNFIEDDLTVDEAIFLIQWGIYDKFKKGKEKAETF